MRERAAAALLFALLAAAPPAAGAARLVDAPPPARPSGAPAPRIAAEPAAFDFGKALPQRTLTKEFTLRNYGAADLRIEKVTSDCGCTVASGFAEVIKPGGSTPLRVSLQTRDARGRITKKVLVRSNDPARSLLEIAVSAEVTAGR